MAVAMVCASPSATAPDAAGMGTGVRPGAAVAAAMLGPSSFAAIDFNDVPLRARMSAPAPMTSTNVAATANDGRDRSRRTFAPPSAFGGAAAAFAPAAAPATPAAPAARPIGSTADRFASPASTAAMMRDSKSSGTASTAAASTRPRVFFRRSKRAAQSAQVAACAVIAADASSSSSP